MDDETRRVGEIEADIAETRVELTETVEAIQERLTPSNIVSNATESVRHAASERVRQMTDNRFMDTIRSNPIPAAMIGIGAAWLYFKGRPDGDGYSRYSQDWRYGPDDTSRRFGRGGEYPVGTRGETGYRGAAESDESIGEQVSSMGRDLTARTRDLAGDVRETARDTTRRAQLKFNDVLRDNPLMLGAAAALIGAAIGLSIPATETENQLMGEARDAVVDRAQNMASDAASRVSDAASNVQQAAGRVADTASKVASSPRTSKS